MEKQLTAFTAIPDHRGIYHVCNMKKCDFQTYSKSAMTRHTNSKHPDGLKNKEHFGDK